LLFSLSLLLFFFFTFSFFLISTEERLIRDSQIRDTERVSIMKSVLVQFALVALFLFVVVQAAHPGCKYTSKLLLIPLVFFFFFLRYLRNFFFFFFNVVF